ncbi:hypothetical protein [Halolactibacillus sp. JCM 19043]|uniref:hypothetical protein n=1 Tax=Halolactibacillus sp. JCM 19043 TaxID=1460638 RepID=UPI0018D03E72|nr:hypothetical protein [Halolactibacillus sp. JCM 19043]
MLKVSSLSKVYKRTTAVDDVNFDVSKGEIAVLVGPMVQVSPQQLKVLSVC